MYEISVKISFDAAHRLLDYVGKCSNLHGHSYVAIVGIESESMEPGSPGFVYDFGTLKRIIKEWIDEHWDHAAILHKKDPLVVCLREHVCQVFEMDNNPTAEYMANHLFKIVCGFFHHREKLKVTHVTIKETCTTWATWYARKGE